MTKYQIKIKRDWNQYGYWNNVTRKMEKTGFVVVQNGLNCIPGACWFKTIEDAMIGIQAHMITGDCSDFYDVYKKMKNKQYTHPIIKAFA